MAAAVEHRLGAGDGAVPLRWDRAAASRHGTRRRPASGPAHAASMRSSVAISGTQPNLRLSGHRAPLRFDQDAADRLAHPGRARRSCAARHRHRRRRGRRRPNAPQAMSAGFLMVLPKEIWAGCGTGRQRLSGSRPTDAVSKLEPSGDQAAEDLRRRVGLHGIEDFGGRQRRAEIAILAGRRRRDRPPGVGRRRLFLRQELQARVPAAAPASLAMTACGRQLGPQRRSGHVTGAKVPTILRRASTLRVQRQSCVICGPNPSVLPADGGS